MNNARLDRLIRQLEGVEGEIEGRPGFWQFTFRGFQTYVITDERADRMRIMTPIARIEDVSAQQLAECMKSNFDRALDALG